MRKVSTAHLFSSFRTLPSEKNHFDSPCGRANTADILILQGRPMMKRVKIALDDHWREAVDNAAKKLGTRPLDLFIAVDAQAGGKTAMARSRACRASWIPR